MTLGLVTVLAGARAAKADLPAGPGDVPRSTLAPADYNIVKHLHALSELAITAGQIAQKNGDSKAVRDFGATLVSDHTAGDQELLAYAKKAGIDPNRMKNEPAPRDMAAYLQSLDRLRALTGQRFDQDFAVTMRDGYARTMALIQNTQPSISDRSLSALLDKRLPVLERNYQTAAGLAATQAPPSTTTDQHERSAPKTTP